MSSIDWQCELDGMLMGFERQAKFSLRRVKRSFVSTGESLNEEFRKYFLRISNERLSTSYATVQMEPQRFDTVDSLLDRHQINNDSNGMGSVAANSIDIETTNPNVLDSDDEQNDDNRQIIKIEQETNDSIKGNGNVDSNESNPTINMDDDDESNNVNRNIDSNSVDSKIAESVNSNQTNDVNDVFEVLDSDDEMDTAPSNVVKSEQQQLNITNGNDRYSKNDNQSKGGDTVKDEIDNAPKQEATHEIIPLKAFRLIGVLRSGRASVRNGIVNGNIGVGLGSRPRNGLGNGNENVGVCAGTSSKGGQQRKQTGNTNDDSKSRSKVAKAFKCKQCRFTTKFKWNLLVHQRKHTGERPYRCGHCFKRFTQSSHLKRHMIVHKNDLPIQCQRCFSGFTQENEKRAHEDSCRIRRYDCYICGKCVGSVVGHLKYHMRVKHTGERAFACHHCNKDFVLSSDLKSHMRSHTGEKPFRCEICEKRFALKGNLNVHLNTVHRYKNI